MNTIHVVAGVRIQEDRFWVCQRSDDGDSPDLEGWWEFPGGKVDDGESYTDALHREFREEFDTSIGIWTKLAQIPASFPNRNNIYIVHFYRIELLDPPTLKVHKQDRWETLETLSTMKHLPSGELFIKHLLEIKKNFHTGKFLPAEFLK